jgi:hypothetical protein
MKSIYQYNYIHLSNGVLVKNIKSNQVGMLIKKSIFEDYYHVFCKGYLQEWHISNIDRK